MLRNGWRVAPLSLSPACYTLAFAAGRCRSHPYREGARGRKNDEEKLRGSEVAKRRGSEIKKPETTPLAFTNRLTMSCQLFEEQISR